MMMLPVLLPTTAAAAAAAAAAAPMPPPVLVPAPDASAAPGVPPPPPAPGPDANGLYTIAAVSGVMMMRSAGAGAPDNNNNNCFLYRVEWAGYPDAADFTWEPLEHLAAGGDVSVLLAVAALDAADIPLPICVHITRAVQSVGRTPWFALLDLDMVEGDHADVIAQLRLLGS